ncbi:exosortase F system-associated membrane protein [Urechidicola sp. KH5]
MSVVSRIVGVLGAVLLLVLIRAFAANLFYDPFIIYFKNEFLQGGFPEVDLPKLVMSLFLRFALNTGISLLVIYYAFLDLDLVKFSMKVFLLCFLILSTIFVVLVSTKFSSGYLFPFYIRRILIHPILLLLLLPAFYFQKR